MIWLRRENSKKWEFVYCGCWGKCLRPLFGLTGIKALALERRLFPGSSIGFVGQLTGLESLKISDFKLSDCQVIERLIKLRKLRLQTPSLHVPVDLRRFPDLQELSMETGMLKNLESCENLEQLFVTKIKLESLSSLNGLRKLKSAQFSEPTFVRIGPVDLPNLESLIFKAVRELEDWSGLEGLPALQKFWIFAAPKLRTLEPFSRLQSLEWLLLDDCGRIESLAPISRLPCLRRVNIIGNTRIMDGRVSTLLEVPQLLEVSFPSRPTYDATEVQLMQAIANRRR